VKTLICILILIFVPISIFGQDVVVSATRENRFYRGIDNPIQIAVSGVRVKTIFVKTDNGTIEKIGNSLYLYKSKEKGRTQIFVYKISRKDTILLDTKYFRVKDLPYPTALVGSMKEGVVKKSVLVGCSGLRCQLDGFDINLTYKIIGYTAIIVRKNGDVWSQDFESAQFSPELKMKLRETEIGDRIYFEDIRVVPPWGEVLMLDGIRFEIE